MQNFIFTYIYVLIHVCVCTYLALCTLDNTVVYLCLPQSANSQHKVLGNSN